MSSPYPGSPPPQQPQGGSPYGGGPGQSGSSWGGAPPPPGPGGPPPVPGAGGPQPPAGAAPPERKKPWPWILGVCGCLVLVLVLAGGGGLALFAFSGGDDDPVETGMASGPTETETAEATTEEPTEETTTEEPTTEEPTTEEPTTEEPTTEEPTADTGLPGLPIFASTPVQDPTDDDLDAAKQALLDYLTGLSDNDPVKTCGSRLDPLTGVGITEDSFLYDSCLESTQEEIDSNEWDGVASFLHLSDFDAELDAENRVVLVTFVHTDEPIPAQIAKGDDGGMYLASF